MIPGGRAGSGMDDGYVTQMRDIYLVSRNIAHWYLLTTPYIAEAGRLSFTKSFKGKQHENQNRGKLIQHFGTLVLMSCRLPKVKKCLQKGKYKFNDGPELLDALWTVEKNGIASTEIVKWWFDYADALVQAGLITVFEFRKSDRAAFSSF